MKKIRCVLGIEGKTCKHVYRDLPFFVCELDCVSARRTKPTGSLIVCNQFEPREEPKCAVCSIGNVHCTVGCTVDGTYDDALCDQCYSIYCHLVRSYTMQGEGKDSHAVAMKMLRALVTRARRNQHNS